ncbi:ABC transporter ATP-binding protein [Phaeobacter porticola]|uniref:Spermidine/putrescine import ATP-binding protein PotA n=1 Tax=Phaeobacter porticola TaxID=1844006 RepID=A0A1L3IAU8_9RHOB|nr:ABC transporter ATP-binding protein [Phaeobacter porticola]APG49202.1 spermidine/putrescine import ATP-binding protein PotA [Phaeobacter porticola]
MTTDTGAFVEFRNIDKTYDGEVFAVRDMNLSIEKGEFITLLGPSGSGKSTTLMMLAGFECPTAGKILYEERELASIPAHKRNFGMVFQNYALFPHMSILENVAFPLAMRGAGKSEAADQARAALDMVHLSHFADRRPSQLSGGQQQRVALARALVFNPAIVLMDEPLGALDKKLREEMQIELKHLHENLGVTFVFVTHDQDEALTMSDRIAVYNDGQIQQIADPTTLYEAPENAFVASFLGDTNMLRGTVSTVSGGMAKVALTDGTMVMVDNAGGLISGQQTQVSVRPERIVLETGDVGITADRIETIYHGAHASVICRTQSGEEITARLPASAIDDVTSDKLRVRFSDRYARAFPIAEAG